MDLPDDMEDVDLVLRHVSRLFPEQFARALAPPGATLTVNGWLDRGLRARTSKREFEELAVAMTAIADTDKRGRCLREQIVAFLPKEVVVQSWIFKQGVEQGVEQGVKQGVKQGIVKGKAEAVLAVLQARGIRVSKVSGERIRRCTDAATLDRWLERAVTVKKTAEIFDDPAS